MREQIFKPVRYSVNLLLEQIESGELGLPTLQRDYVWKPKKVCDLLDSMLEGYPIGYLMIWDASSDVEGSRQVGQNNKCFQAPQRFIVDGQQRLTSLYAAMYGAKVTDAEFEEKKITISFNVLTRDFKAASNKTKKDIWIYDISEVFHTKNIGDYISKKTSAIEAGQSKAGKMLTDTDKQDIKQNIETLNAMGDYEIPTLKISGNADEESVADIFVRVNSKGTVLKHDDFILTLISLYWVEGRNRIQDFCKSTKKPGEQEYNGLFQPSPTQIVRIVMSYGFRRARLSYAYMLLRGRNFDDKEKEVYPEELRNEQFEKLKVALGNALDAQVWREFLKCVQKAGFISKKMITSDNTLVYTYALYLIGRYDFKMKFSDLREIFSKWFFMVSVSGYYKSSSDSVMETDLADLRDKKTADEFTKLLEQKIKSIFTDDYFKTTLPNNLSTSKADNPSWFGYCAALNILDAKGLFSNSHTRELFDPNNIGNNKALEKHHLFPKAYLARIGITSTRDQNQNANYAFIDWTDNIDISDTSPAEYMKEQLVNTPDDEKAEIYANNALPMGWENMDYFEFLNRRRELMAQVIKQGYDRL